MIRTSDIRIDGGTQARAAIDQATVDDLFADFPITPAQIAESAWRGHCIAAAGVVVVTVTASERDAALFHCRVAGRGITQTRLPVPAALVAPTVEAFLVDEKLAPHDLTWKPVQEAPLDANERGDEIVYFLRAGDFIKIGKATERAEYRVAQLQTGCPFKIEIIGTIRAGYRAESRLHRRFRHLRAHGEWFRATDEIVAAVNQIIAGDAE